MSETIKIVLIDNNNKNKYLEEIEIERPKTLDDLRSKLKKKMKNFPDYFNLFYKSDDKEINIQNNEEYQLSKNNILFICQNNPEEHAGTLYNKNINNTLLENKKEENLIEDNDQTILSKNENKKIKKIIEENNKFIEATILFFKSIYKRLKEIDLLINNTKNNKLENLIKNLSQEIILKSYDEISKIILEEMDIIYQYINNKLIINSINGENTNENKKEKTRIKKSQSSNKKKIIAESKDKSISLVKTSEMPYSCIPRINKNFMDISYDKYGPE